MQREIGVESELQVEDFASSIDADDRKLIAGLLDSSQWIVVNQGESTLRKLNVRASKTGRPDVWMLPTQKSGAKARGRAYALSVASLSEPVPEYPQHEVVRCLACGKLLSSALARLGSLRCLECRESEAQLDPELVALWQQRGAPF